MASSTRWTGKPGVLQSTGCAKSWTRLNHCTEWSPALPALSVGGPWSQHAPPLTAVLTLGSPETEVGPRWLGGGGERGLFPVLRGAPFSPPPTSPPVLCSQHPCFRAPPQHPDISGNLHALCLRPSVASCTAHVAAALPSSTPDLLRQGVAAAPVKSP